MTNENVVYIQINDWHAKDYNKRLLYCYLEGYQTIASNVTVDYPEGVVCKTIDEAEQWMIDNKLCINSDCYDMSSQMWITTTKEWVENNFSELMPYVSENPEDYMYKNDRKYFLKYIPENYGMHFSTPICGLEEDIDEYLADGRFAFPELFETNKK